jgi:hypothetical protein
MNDTEKILRNLETSEWAAREVLILVRRYVEWHETPHWDEDSDEPQEYQWMDAYHAGRDICLFINMLRRSPYDDFSLMREADPASVDWRAVAWSWFDKVRDSEG